MLKASETTHLLEQHALSFFNLGAQAVNDGDRPVDGGPRAVKGRHCKMRSGTTSAFTRFNMCSAAVAIME
jgi:hypothetical protein